MGLRKQKAMWVGLALSLLTATSAPAADAPPTPRQLELTQRYFNAMHMDRQFDAMMKPMAAQMAQSLEKRAPEMTAAERQAFGDAMAEAMKTVTNRMMDRMQPMFAATFTEDELQQAVTFYESPTGQSLLAKSSAVMAKLMPEMMASMPALMTEAMTQVCAKVKCPAGMPPSAPR